ncbi:MAG: ribonuclease J [Alphaproteobacteria bacterium]|nr:ribonuclease J [Alphaproteobacteria bacterium]
MNAPKEKMMTADFHMKPDAVYFVPLGGCGFFGANMALYGYNNQWIMVDCGMGFADDTMPGVDILLPDPSFAASLGDKLLGIIFTHGHEDHIGAIEHLWPRLKKPLYATGFTAARVRKDLLEQSWGDQARLYEVDPKKPLVLGPFSIRFIDVAHSIPEAQSLAIRVGDLGTILHTGDWKIDADPVVGKLTDAAGFKALGDEGVLALVGDSTNAMVPGHSGSERTVCDNLAELFGEFSGAIVVSCFSTNVARMHSIYHAAQTCGRQVCLVGRSLWAVEDAARETGYMRGLPPFLEGDVARQLPSDKLVYICTGSQGEPRAALSRISNDDHPEVSLAPGDVVIFSSRTIPGNERAIERIKNRLYALGVDIVTERDAPVHVSGHPYRDELKQMYEWTRPRFAIPVHGERMQMEKHGLLARECGVENAIIPENGKVIEITAQDIRIIGHVKSGVLAIEGKRLVETNHEAILARKRIMWNGSLVVTAVVSAAGDLLAPVQLTALGLLDENSELDAGYITDVIEAIGEKVRNLSKDDRRDDHMLSEAIRVTARRFFAERFDRKPQTRVHLVRV